jgi:hypothetical protein
MAKVNVRYEDHLECACVADLIWKVVLEGPYGGDSTY